MGLFDTDISTTHQYKDLLINLSQALPWLHCGAISARAETTSWGQRKVWFLFWPVHRYMHAVISHSIAGEPIITSVVGWQELYFLYCDTLSRRTST